MNTLLQMSSSLVERIAQPPKSLRAYQSLEYDPTTTVISIVTESLAAHRMLDLKHEAESKAKKECQKRLAEDYRSHPYRIVTPNLCTIMAAFCTECRMN